MKSTRYTEEQIIRILQEVESGKAVTSVYRQYNAAETTVLRWRGKYGDMVRRHYIVQVDDLPRNIGVRREPAGNFVEAGLAKVSPL